MSVKIRLTRGGAKKRPYYRIVVADARAPRDGRFIDKVGAYDPMKAQGRSGPHRARQREDPGLARQGRAACQIHRCRASSIRLRPRQAPERGTTRRRRCQRKRRRSAPLRPRPSRKTAAAPAA